VDDRLLRSRGVLAVFAVFGIVLILQLLTAGTREADGRTAPNGSSFATHDDGYKALRQLLEIDGHDVTIARRGFDEVPPDPASTVFVIAGARLSTADQEVLRAFVERGGHLVMAAQPLGTLIGADLSTVTDPAGRRTVTYPYPGLEAVDEVAAPNALTFRDPGPLVGAIGAPDMPTVGLVHIGDGVVWAVADPSILANGSLDQADNAALGLVLAGDPVRTVVFTEYVHGFGPITGLASLPSDVQTAIWLAAIAGIVWMLGRSRRFGPPERPSRPLAPPRAAYVDALAASLARTNELAAATAPIRDRIRRELAHRGGDAPGEVARVAAQLGVDGATLEHALAPPASEDDAIAAAGVLAALSKHRV
jgi:hypothetical protein